MYFLQAQLLDSRIAKKAPDGAVLPGRIVNSECGYFTVTLAVFSPAFTM